MLTPATRPHFHTLLDALTLQEETADREVVFYVEADRPAIRISQKGWRQTVLTYAVAMRHMGIEPCDLVVIAHTQNLESMYAFWGAIVAGAIPSMFPTLTEKLDPDVYINNLATLVQLSGVSAILTTDAFAAVLREHVCCPVVGSEALAASISRSEAAKFVPAAPEPDGIAFLQHSSGTTGLQKGVALTHRAVLNQVATYSGAIHLNEEDVVVSWLPLYHDMGLIAGFIMPLVQGIPLVLMSPFDWVKHPALLLRAIHDYGGTLCWLPNFAYNHCARRIRRRDVAGVSLATMRMFVNCSEPVRHESHSLFLQRFSALGIRPQMLAVSYAMAENTFAVTQTPPGMAATLDVVDRQALAQKGLARPVAADHPAAGTRVSCGSPIAETAVRVVDKEGQALPERQVGEIAIRSNCMLVEYYRRPDLRPFHNGWYLTGDRGYLAEGELYVIGRSQDLIINAGKNIYPQDIEAIVNQVPGVYPGRAVVFGVPDEREGTELITIVAEVKTDDPAGRKAIARAVRQTVARQSMVTVSYVHLVNSRWLIKTSSGKIARAANRDKWLAEKRQNKVI